LQASVAAGTNWTAATGTSQSFTVDKAAGSVSISNIPGTATYGGNFTPTYTLLGDGNPSVVSQTLAVCTVSSGVVSYVGSGTCTLQASVTAGANGVVLFDASGIDPHARALIGRGVGLGCFKLTREFGIFDARELLFSGRFASSVAVRIFGLSHPWDGCEIQGSYGHRWPDRNGSHSAVEIALTDKGRRYFADRAAARDLALFVRSAKMQRIRKLTGAALIRGLAPYPIVRLGSPDASPALGKIGYAPTADGVTFVERSGSGRRFVVEVRNRRIVGKKLRPYALVF